MDPILPISSRLTGLPSVSPPPVERVSRERDGHDLDERDPRKRKPRPEQAPREDPDAPPDGEDGHRHVDVRA